VLKGPRNNQLWVEMIEVNPIIVPRAHQFAAHQKGGTARMMFPGGKTIGPTMWIWPTKKGSI